MRFLMLVCIDPDTPADAPDDDGGDDVDTWVDEMDSRGIRLIGEVIRPEQEAKTVRVRDGELVVTDGPFLETKEILAGFDVLDCADVDEAVRVAAAHPMARRGVLELRPFHQF